MRSLSRSLFSSGFALAGVVALALAAAPANAQIVTNGSFEQPSIGANTFIISNAVPGWTRDASSLGSGIEIQHENVAGHAFDGVQYLELDSDGVTAVYQDLVTLPGESYTLSFAYSPRAGVDAANNTLHISWGGSLIDTLSQTGIGNADNVWSVHTYFLTATGSSTRLTFDNLGTPSNSLGTYVDAVNVTRRTPEPGALALAFAGALPLATFLRRRR